MLIMWVHHRLDKEHSFLYAYKIFEGVEGHAIFWIHLALQPIFLTNLKLSPFWLTFSVSEREFLIVRVSV